MPVSSLPTSGEQKGGDGYLLPAATKMVELQSKTFWGTAWTFLSPSPNFPLADQLLIDIVHSEKAEKQNS